MEKVLVIKVDFSGADSHFSDDDPEELARNMLTAWGEYSHSGEFVSAEWTYSGGEGDE